MNVEVACSAPLVCDPLSARLPDHAPEAVQLVASVADQLSVAALPRMTVVGDAVSVTVGSVVDGGATVIVVVWVADPPAPVQVKPYVDVACRLASVSLPVAALLPLHAPVALHDVAPAADHVSVLGLPRVTVLGDAVRLTDGAVGSTTLTLAECVALPPGPLQVSANAESAASGPTVALPVVGLSPLQLPDAEQRVASVDDHVSVVVAPLATDAGTAASVTEGAFGTVGDCSTPTVTV